jgi:hypothetical protein
VIKKLRVITRNYEPKLLRVSRNYDVEVHEITHFIIITKGNLKKNMDILAIF